MMCGLKSLYAIPFPVERSGKTLACHRCDPDSNQGISMWKDRDRSSKVGRFPVVSPHLKDRTCQYPRHQEVHRV